MIHRGLLVIFLLFSFSVQAQGSFGLGVIVGSWTGLSAKVHIGKQHSVDGVLSLHDGDTFYFHGTYLWEKGTAFRADRSPVRWYYGVGPRLLNHKYRHGSDDELTSHVDIGVRAPVGLSAKFAKGHLELFGELAFGMDVIPVADMDMGGGLGLRFYF